MNRLARIVAFVVCGIMSRWRPGMRVVVSQHREDRRVVAAEDWGRECMRTLYNVAIPSPVFSPFCGCDICARVRAGVGLTVHIPPGAWVQ